MFRLQEDQGQAFCRNCWQMAAGLLGFQWKVMASQYQTGLKLTEVMLRMPVNQATQSDEAAVTTQEVRDDFRKLEHRAAERVRQGLAPPKEIYETPYRDRIDWSRFPEWARPNDPEVFEGCGHEG